MGAWETVFGEEGGLFRRLRGACAAEWEAYTWHPFVRGLSDGTLPLAAFRRYLVQDYLFLLHFARAEALAVVKAESVEAMREKAATVGVILDELSAKIGEKLSIRRFVRYELGEGIEKKVADLAADVAATIAGTN